MELWLAACRLAHFLGLMLAFGAALYVRVIAPREIRAEVGAALRPLAMSGAVAALIGALGWLALEAPAMSGDPADLLNVDAWSAIAFDTAFGHVWLPRLVLSLALTGTLPFMASRWGGLALALSAATLASLGLVGHASMQSGLVGWAHRLNDATHLLCAGYWFGGLCGFVATMRLYSRGASKESAVSAMMRYSTWGHLAVALLVLSGVANIALTTGAIPWPPNSPYRLALSVKICIAITMACIAIFNRYIITPRLRARPSLGGRLIALCWVQLGLGSLAVALVGGFGLLEPA